MADTSDQVPGRFDVIINGHGYVFADTVDPSLPFRTHRAIYDLSQTFVERQNVSNTYGDNTQDFFLTATQNDWALGEQQRFFRSNNADSIRRYWKGTNINPVFLDGRVFLRPKAATVTPSTSESTGAASISVDPTKVLVWGGTNLYSIIGNVSSKIGAHGLGSAPDQFAVCNDGDTVYFSSGGGTTIRNWDGASTFITFSSVSASCSTLCFVGNTLWGGRAGGVITYYSTAGVATDAFQFKGGDGSVLAQQIIKLAPYGGQVLALTAHLTGTSPASLWVGDTTGFKEIAEFNQGFIPKDMCVAEGIVFVSGLQGSFPGPSVGNVQTINYYANGNIGRLWQSKSTTSNGSINLAPFDQGVLFSDDSTGTVQYYNIATGGTSTVFSYSVNGSPTIAAGSNQVVVANGSTTVTGLAATTAATSGTVQSSLFDFDSTLTKVFRGVTVDWENAINGDTGGTVDVAYQVDSLDGSYTSLATGVTSGTETSFSSSVTGTAISIQVTLNKGSSSYGPALKRISVRAAPQLPQYRSGLFIIDCTGSTSFPRELRDGTYHPLTGYDQVQNLLTAAKATTPFSVTDRLGTYTALMDLNDPEGFDVYEVRPNTENVAKSGSFLVRLKVRQV